MVYLNGTKTLEQKITEAEAARFVATRGHLREPAYVPPQPDTPLRDDEEWKWFPRLGQWVSVVKEQPDTRPLWPDDYLWPKD